MTAPRIKEAENIQLSESKQGIEDVFETNERDEQ